MEVTVGSLVNEVYLILCRHSTNREVAIMLLLAYLSYMIAEVYMVYNLLFPINLRNIYFTLKSLFDT